MGKKIKNITIKINKTDLLLNSANKLGRHTPEVRTGCGVTKSKKQYTRKKKHKGKEEG